MTQDQENTTSMFETTMTFLDQNNSLWSAKAAFAAAVTEAKSGVAAIRATAASQESPTTGITDEKEQARTKLEDRTQEVADQVAALAAKNADMSLASKVQVTRSSLDQEQDDDLVQIAERVRDAANANLAALGPYGVTAAVVTDLTDAITTFSGMRTAPRTAAVARTAATESVSNLIRTTRSLFRNQLDKMMTPFRASNPEFYNGYFAARVIVKRAATQAPTPPPPTPPPPTPPAPGP